MKKLESLSAEQLKTMAEVRKFWLDQMFAYKNKLNKKKANKAIEWLYNLAGLKKPIIIYVDSPMACQYAVYYLKNVFNDGSIAQVRAQVGDQVRAQVRDQVGDQVWDQVRDQVWDQVWDQVGDQVWAQVWDQVRDQVGDQVVDQVWDQVRAQVGDQVWDQVRAQVRDQVGDQVRDQVGDHKIEFQPFCSYGSAADYGWVSFHEFFKKIGIGKHEGFEAFRELLLCGGYDMIQLNGFCIVSSMPTKIFRNNNNRLHNPTGPAIEFGDGYKLYFINGRAMPAWIFEQAAAGKITKEKFLSETNSDIKGGIYEVMGQKRMMEMLGAVEVDTQTINHRNGTKEVVTLFKTKERFKEIDNEPMAWVKMVCPSTGTQYLQGVEPHHTNALEAIASLSPFKPEEYSFDMRS